MPLISSSSHSGASAEVWHDRVVGRIGLGSWPPRASSGGSAGLATVDSTVFKGDFSPTFTLDLACKDMGLALGLAKQMQVPMRVAPIVQQLMIEGLAHGLGEMSSVVMKLLEHAAGLEVRSR